MPSALAGAAKYNNYAFCGRLKNWLQLTRRVDDDRTVAYRICTMSWRNFIGNGTRQLFNRQVYELIYSINTCNIAHLYVNISVHAADIHRGP